MAKGFCIRKRIMTDEEDACCLPRFGKIYCRPCQNLYWQEEEAEEKPNNKEQQPKE